MSNNKKHIKTGFTTPEKYFKNFDEKMLSKLSTETIKVKLPDNSGFKTPISYFINYEEKILDNILIEHDQISKNKITGFIVPEDYFYSFEEELFKKVAIPETKIIWLFSIKNIFTAVSIAAIFILSFFIIKPNSTNTLTFDDIEYAALENYLNTEDIDISALELVDLYNVDTNQLNNISFFKIEDENILEYLSDETTSDDYYDYEL